jgi:hypothetical protein
MIRAMYLERRIFCIFHPRAVLFYLLVALSSWSYAQPFSANTKTVSIFVRDNAMIRIAAQDLANLGITPGDWKIEQINIYYQGDKLPLYIRDDAPAGNLTPRTEMIFWGERPGALEPGLKYHSQTLDNVYLLVLGDPSQPLRIRPQPLEKIEKNQVVDSVEMTIHLEKNEFLNHYRHYMGFPSDRVMWERVNFPPWTPTVLEFDAMPDGVEDVECRLRIHLWGNSNPKNATPSHDWEIYINEMPVGMAVWSDLEHYVFDTEFDPTYLNDDEENRLGFIRANVNSAPKLDSVLVDFAELTVNRRLVLRGNELEIPGTGREHLSQALRVELASVDLPLTAYYQNQEAAYQIEKDSQKNIILPRHEDISTGTCTAIRLISQPALQSPHHMQLARRLKMPEFQPDVLVITHEKFYNHLERWRKFREEQGLDVFLVECQNIYNQYRKGLFSQESIREFVWDVSNLPTQGEHRTRYLWLVGDATLDNFNIEGGPINYVPTYRLFADKYTYLPHYDPSLSHDSAFSIEPGQDLDTPPRLAVGRFPCNTTETLDHYISKVIDYENSLKTPGDWTDRALLIAGEGFGRTIDVVAEKHLPGWTLGKVYSDGVSDENNEAKIEEILGKFNQGAGFVYFAGHGSYNMWKTFNRLLKVGNPGSYKTLIAYDQVNQLENYKRYPVVYAATCFTTLFDAPFSKGGGYEKHGDNGVGIYMVEKERGGAVAVIGSCSKVSVGAANTFLFAMLSAAGDSETGRLGDAFLQAKIGRTSNSYHGISLIGDPSLRVADVFRK